MDDDDDNDEDDARGKKIKECAQILLHPAKFINFIRTRRKQDNKLSRNFGVRRRRSDRLVAPTRIRFFSASSCSASDTQFVRARESERPDLLCTYLPTHIPEDPDLRGSRLHLGVLSSAAAPSARALVSDFPDGNGIRIISLPSSWPTQPERRPSLHVLVVRTGFSASE